MADRPPEPVIVWVHMTEAQLGAVNAALRARGESPWPLGQLISDADFRKLAEWIVRERAYVRELERLTSRL